MVDWENIVIRVQSRTPMNISELVAYYLRAVERFRAHSEGQTGRTTIGGKSHAQAALAEALNWADTIDQYLREGPRGTRGTDRDPNWAAPVDGSNGELVRAFQYARNNVHHQWWNLVVVEVGTSLWLWGDTPTPKRASDSSKSDGFLAFERQMRGAKVLTTLDSLAEVFWKRRGWEIHRSDIEQPGYPVGSALPFDPERDDD